MKKILAITDEIVTIGGENGELIEVTPSCVTYDARVGDYVSVFSSETKTIVSKYEGHNEPVSAGAQSQGSGNITINVANENNTQPQGAPAAYIQAGKVVNKLVYALLAIFLGGLGAHKFYAGKIGAGIVYLIFCWTFIPALIGLIEGLVALTKQADANGNIIV